MRKNPFFSGLFGGLLGAILVFATGSVGSTLSLFSGPWDPGQTQSSLNSLINTMNGYVFSYVQFNQAGEIGEMAVLSSNALTVNSGTTLKGGLAVVDQGGKIGPAGTVYLARIYQ